jgi:hypothetical protein
LEQLRHPKHHFHDSTLAHSAADTWYDQQSLIPAFESRLKLTLMMSDCSGCFWLTKPVIVVAVDSTAVTSKNLPTCCAKQLVKSEYAAMRKFYLRID